MSRDRNDELERRLRASLRARATDVEPTPELWRKVEARVTRRVRYGWVLAAAGVAALVAVAAVVLPSIVRDNGGPFIDPVPGPAAEADATAYFVRSADRGLFVEPETHELSEPVVGAERAAVEALVAGSTLDPDLTTAVPDGTRVLGVEVREGVLYVDLSEEVRQGTGSAMEMVFAQQLAHTATQFDGVVAVRLLVEGEAVDELWGHEDWSQPVEPDPFALSPVHVQAPRWGEVVEVGEVTVSGEATVFEANVLLWLVAPDGTVVEESFATATAGAPERGQWSYTFEIGEPGTWTVRASEGDPSGGEGPPPFEVEIAFEVVAP